jgi:hypothetical protein
MVATRTIAGRRTTPVRLIGAGVAGIGLAFLMQSIVPAV